MSTYSSHCCSENSYLNGNCNNQCYNNIDELRSLPNSPPYTFAPTMDDTGWFEKMEIKTKNLTVQPQDSNNQRLLHRDPFHK